MSWIGLEDFDGLESIATRKSAQERKRVRKPDAVSRTAGPVALSIAFSVFIAVLPADSTSVDVSCPSDPSGGGVVACLERPREDVLADLDHHWSQVESYLASIKVDATELVAAAGERVRAWSTYDFKNDPLNYRASGTEEPDELEMSRLVRRST